jgi:hypothetical protein
LRDEDGTDVAAPLAAIPELAPSDTGTQRRPDKKSAAKAAQSFLWKRSLESPPEVKASCSALRPGEMMALNRRVSPACHKDDTRTT